VYDPGAFELYRTSPSRAACPSGERLSNAQTRMVEALQLLGNRHAGETIVAVSHAVMIRLAVARLTGVEGEGWRIPVGRGSLTRFEVRDGEISLTDLPDALVFPTVGTAVSAYVRASGLEWKDWEDEAGEIDAQAPDSGS